jgi:hypothetical protein
VWALEAALLAACTPGRWRARLRIVEPVPDWGGARTWCRRLSWAALALLALGLSLALARRASHSGPEPNAWVADGEQERAWVERFRADPRAAGYGALWQRAALVEARVRPDEVLEVAAEERLRHFVWVASQPRPYAFTLFRTSPHLVHADAGEPSGLVFPGTLPPALRGGGRLVAVGVPLPAPRSTFEVLALADPDLDALVFPPPDQLRAHAAFVASEATGASGR